MSIISIKALFCCDGCNKTASVDFDLAGKMPADWTFHEKAEDIIRGGNSLAGCTSVQGEHLLCEDCTRFIDAAFPEDVLPNYDQVCKALNDRAGV